MFALMGTCVAVLLALLMGMPVPVAGRTAFACLLTLVTATIWDYIASVRAWRRSSPTMTRRLPAAFAMGARRAALVAG